MPVYFVIQTINDSLRGKLSDLKDVHVDAFLIKVGASHTKDTVETREKAYDSQQKPHDVTFVPNLNLPFAAAGRIQKATFAFLICKDKFERVSGTNETYLVKKLADVKGLRDALKPKLADWSKVDTTDAKAVRSYLEELLKIFDNFGLPPSSGCQDKLQELEDKYEELRADNTTEAEEEHPWTR
ncbi:hypothetical protein FRC12_007266 [Ceratobasidium sp. 428]|nr:hypothetical protein FRC12_007266 [Ceratobasidium sp. 428]